MGKFYEINTIFNYTWDQVAKTFWNRYPNPFSSHVLSEDTLCREMRGGELYSRRLFSKTNRLPRWGERFIKTGSRINCVEESFINPETKTITTYTRNIGYTRIMSVIEKVIYKPDPNDPSRTIAHRSAWIESGMYGFRTAIETFGLDRFRKNCVQATNGFSWVLNKFYGDPNETVAPNLGLLGSASEKMKDKARKAGEIAKDSIRKKVYAAPSKQTQGSLGVQSKSD